MTRVAGVVDQGYRMTSDETLAYWAPRVLEATREGLWVWHVPTGEVIHNTCWFANLGFSSGELENTLDAWLARLHPDDRESVWARMRAMVEGEADELNSEHRMLARNGASLWVRERGRVVERNAAGAVIRIAGSHAVITARKLAEYTLLESEHHYRTLANTGSVLIWTSGTDKRRDYFNEPWLRFTGRRLIDELGDGWLAGVHPDDRRAYSDIYAKAFEQCQPFRLDFRLRHADGAYRWISDEAHPRFDRHAHFIGYIGYGNDITARKLAQDRLEQSEASLRSLFDSLQESVYVQDQEGRFISVNLGATRMYGVAREWLIGKTPVDVSAPGMNDLELVQGYFQRVLAGEPQTFEFWGRRGDGTIFPKEVHQYRGTWFGREVVFAIAQDITERKEHERKLRLIAHYDGLTGLPNRVLLADRLQQAMSQAQRRNQRLAVAYIDLDGFKSINDHHGHEAGDQLLTTIATRMRQALRENDTIARLGGDEFVAVLIDLQEARAGEPLIRRLLSAASRPVILGDLELRVSGSIGVTFYPQEDDVDADQLLRQADQAMYQAKLSGKDRYHLFDTEHDRSIRGHHESLARVGLGLERGEFELYYQPKVNLRDGSVIGAEALLRWRHPEHGLLSPSTFLAETEDHPLGIALGEWVLDSAMAQIVAWNALGVDLPVSVNISAHHLQQTDFVARLRTLLRAHPDLRSGRIELEILETSALADVDHVSGVIRACAEFGVSFALDDFGTGYSSLTYLKRLPAACLKIDQSFVRDMLDDPDDLAILDGVVGLAAAFRRQVVAEGVESVEHGEMLLALGCEFAQGYGIARPMPARAIPTWIADWRPEPAWVRARRVEREDLPALFAGIEHRAWVLALQDYLRGERDAPPELDHGHCRFGRWLHANRDRQALSGGKLDVLDGLHRRVHEHARSLLATRPTTLDTSMAWRDLEALRDELVTHVMALLQTT